MNHKKKVFHNNFKNIYIYIYMENLYFIPNNILTKIFKDLTKYKNDYQQYLNYIGLQASVNLRLEHASVYLNSLNMFECS